MVLIRIAEYVCPMDCFGVGYEATRVLVGPSVMVRKVLATAVVPVRWDVHVNLLCSVAATDPAHRPGRRRLGWLICARRRARVSVLRMPPTASPSTHKRHRIRRERWDRTHRQAR